MRSDTSNSIVVVAIRAQLARDFLDDRIARIADRVHRMAESDHDFLALHARADIGFGFVGRSVAGDDLHRDFVGATVLGTAQRADRAGDARMHVAAGAGDHARGERRGVELMLGVQHQRLVQRLGMQLARRLAVQQVQEMRGDRIVVRLAVDPAAVAGEMPPVQEHRTEARHQRSAMSRASSPGESRSGSTVPSTEQPVRSTSIGCALAGTSSSASLQR